MPASASSLVEGFDLLDIGAAIFDDRFRLVFCNDAFRRLRNYPADVCRDGVSLESLLRFNAERGDFGEGDAEAQVAERIAEIDKSEERRIEREMADGQILAIRYRRMASGGLLVTFEDRTAERRAEAALATSEERYALAARVTSDLVYDWDVVNDKLHVSDMFARFTRFDPEKQGPRGWFEAVHPDDKAAYAAATLAHLKGETETLDIEYRVEIEPGRYLWLHDQGAGARGKDGRVTRLVGAVRDVTEIKEARAERDRIETRLASSLATISDGILLVGPDNRVQLWNDRYFQIFTEAAGGANLTDVIVAGKPFFDMIREGYDLGMFKPHPDGVEAWVAARRKAWDKPRSRWELELANGKWILLNERAMPDGGRVSVYTDITELKLRESEAARARAQFEDAIESMSTGFAMFDAEDRLTVWNSRFREYFQDMADAFVEGAYFRDMLSQTIERGLFPAAEGDEAFLERLMERRLKGDGKVRENRLANGLWLQIRDHRTHDGGLVSIYTDITELKNSEQEAQAARERFEEAIEAISAGFVLWDRDDRLVVCNSRYRDYFPEMPDMVAPGVKFVDIVRTGIKRGIFPEGESDSEAYLAQVQKIRGRADGSVRERELANGTWLQITDHRTKDGGIVSIYAEITELKQREEELRRQSAILEATMENMGQGITMVDRDLNTVAFNKQFFELMEFPEERFGKGFSMEEAFRFNAERGEYGPGDVEEQVRKRLELSRKFLPHRFERARPDGRVLEIVGNPVEGGGFVSTYTDITERKQAEEALKEREAALEAALQDFNAVIDNIDYGVLFLGPDLRTKLVNNAFKRLWHIPQEFIDAHSHVKELIEYNRSNDFYDVPADEWDDWLEDRIRRIASGSIPPTEVRRSDGTVVTYQCFALPDGGRMLTYFDITGLKNAEVELRERESKLQTALTELNAVMNNIDYGVIVLDADLRARLVNRRMIDLFDLPEDVVERRMTMREMVEVNRHTGRYAVAAEDWDDWLNARVAAVRAGSIPLTEMHRGDGIILSYQCVALPDGGRLLTYFDITGHKQREAEIARARDEAEAALADLRKAQQRLIQAEKMASLGQLTAGIAHEIKNPLNFVNNFARLSDEMVGELAEVLETPIAALAKEAREDAEDLLATVRGNLAKINEHGRRADSIVKNMLLHSREGPSERQCVSLNNIAAEALNLAYHGARAENPKFNIEMKTDFDDAVGEVDCFPQDMMRVFLNLITNGMYAANKRAQAEKEGFAPEIAVTTKAEGDRVTVEVRDNGAGIASEAREKIFLPFFTTKPAGEGTGLGLSLSFDIVEKQHDGELTVESDPGVFTTFRVTLPRTPPATRGAGE